MGGGSSHLSQGPALFGAAAAQSYGSHGADNIATLESKLSQYQSAQGALKAKRDHSYSQFRATKGQLNSKKEYHRNLPAFMKTDDSTEKAHDEACAQLYTLGNKLSSECDSFDLEYNKVGEAIQKITLRIAELKAMQSSAAAAPAPAPAPASASAASINSLSSNNSPTPTSYTPLQKMLKFSTISSFFDKSKNISPKFMLEYTRARQRNESDREVYSIREQHCEFITQFKDAAREIIHPENLLETYYDLLVSIYTPITVLQVKEIVNSYAGKNSDLKTLLESLEYKKKTRESKDAHRPSYKEVDSDDGPPV